MSAARAHGRILGRLYGVGVGPGDPELVTVKAARIIGAAPVVAYFARRGNCGHARTIAQGYLSPGVVEVPMHYPMTTESAFDSTDYICALAGFYEAQALALAAHLDAGRDVALICEGDPMFYGSFMHLYERLRGRYPTEICAGVSGMSGCWASAGHPMTWGDDVLSVVPGTLPESELTARLNACDAAVVMKLGRNFGKVRRAIVAAGLLDRATYVERGTMAGERVVALRDMREESAPYFALILVPGRGRRP